MLEKEERSEVHRRQKAKNWTLLAALVAFIVLVYFVSIVRMGMYSG
ncbi:hypothetical protein [Pelagibius sp. Alg239-R121]|nr:hypothetical protein [Pelagibius sp. Alg239-R121]